eukprot:scaffold109278_cov96-Cyclotella_meneghiniana.AAC.1
MRRKESIWAELEYQMSLGENGLAEEDQYLLELNLDDLDHSTGEDQAIWLLSLKAARKVRQLGENRDNTAAAGGIILALGSQYCPGVIPEGESRRYL